MNDQAPPSGSGSGAGSLAESVSEKDKDSKKDLQKDLQEDLLSSVLIMINENKQRSQMEPSLLKLALGVDITTSLQRTIEKMSEASSSLDVIVLPLLVSLNKKFQEKYQNLKASKKSVQIILIADSDSTLSDLEEAYEELKPYKILDSFFDPRLEKSIETALERAHLLLQNKALEDLVQNQKKQLESFTHELEMRIEKRQLYLEESRDKAHEMNLRWQLLRETTVSVQQAQSIGQMEFLLLEALKKKLKISTVRIIFKPQDEDYYRQIKKKSQVSFFRSALYSSVEEEKYATVFFFREEETPFLKEDCDFLTKISETISLAVIRLLKIRESENLKEQWETTFNAISDPLCLLNSNYEIILTNHSFSEQTGLNAESLIQKKCYQVLFQKEKPCSECQLGGRFRLENREEKNPNSIKSSSSKTYEVYSHPLNMKLPQVQRVSPTPSEKTSLELPIFVNQYHEVTETLKMEKKLLQSARLAELGTIGSSIAHELNNPLGGMLSFLQLIKMDLTPQAAFYSDINEMEEGVKRCRDIVENLLGFSRQSNLLGKGKSSVNLKEVIQRAIKIIELQTRPRGIEIRTQYQALSSEAPLVYGDLSSLSYAFKNILQNAVDSLLETQAKKPFSGLIEVRVLEKQRPKANNPSFHQDSESSSLSTLFYQVIFLDNGPDIKIQTGLEASITADIINDHQGQIEFLTSPKSVRTVRVILPAFSSPSPSPTIS